MKLEVSKTELTRALEVAVRAVDAKAAQVIYSSLMLEAAAEGLTVTGTDGEITLSARANLCPGDRESGKVAVNAENFVSVIKGFKGAIISLTAEKTQLIAKCGRSRYALPLVTGESWPIIPKVEPQVSMTIHEEALAAALARVLPAVGNDPSRPTICGTYWRLGAGTLTLVATDTHRLHVATVPVPAQAGQADFLLGTAATKELVKVLQADNDCQVTTDGGCVRIEGSWGVFLSTLIGGKYVAYERFIPTMSDYAEFAQEELEDAIRRAGFVAQGSADRLVVTLGDESKLEAASEQYGEAEEELLLTGGNTGEQQFAVSAKNLGAAVAAVPDTSVRLYRSGTHRGILVSGAAADRFFGVVIPMRLPSDA